MLTRPFRRLSVLILFVLSSVLPTNMVTQGQHRTTPLKYEVRLPLIINNGLVENVNERLANLRVFKGLKDGRPIVRYQYFPEAIYYRNLATGQWEDINPNLVLDAATGNYRNTAASFTAQFANPSQRTNKAIQPQLLVLREPTRPTLAFELATGNLPPPHVEGSTITYAGVTPGQDVIYSIESWGIKEEVILHHSAASPTFSLLLRQAGLKPRAQADGSWAMADTTGKTRWILAAPFGADANGVAANLSLEVTPAAAGSYLVTLKVDPEWLTAPDRAFPVRLDPSVTTTQFVGSESYVQSVDPNIISYKQRNRFLGYSSLKGIARVFLPMDLNFLPDSVQGEDIRSVELVLTQYSWNGGGTFNTSIYPIQAGPVWSDLTLTWNNQPPTGSTPVASLAVSSDMGPKYWDITNWVKQVRSESIANNGLMIRADNETQGGAIFWSSQCGTLCPSGDRPYLQVDVSDNPLFGDGHDGDLIVPSGQTITVDAARASVNASGMSATPANSIGFSVGDLVLFHQTQGTANVERMEFNRIAAINSPTSWTLENPLSLTYNSSAGRAQVLKVPQYRNVTVETNGVLTASSWNGSTGGILMFKASGTMNVASGGKVIVNGLGFRGGAGGHREGPGSADSERHGYQGESPTGLGGRASAANSGGGGAGQADLSSGDGGGGGGGGSYSSSGQNGTVDNIHPGQGAGQGSTLTYGIPSLSAATFGGAGGGGGSDDDPTTTGGAGGNGGGFTLVFAKSLTNLGAITASGVNGGNGSQSGKDGSGGGGGGAGGSIRLIVDTAEINTVQSVGGTGGSKGIQSGAGGAAGDGRIRIEYCTALNGGLSTSPSPSIQQINCGGMPVGSGLNLLTDTYQFPNKEGIPNYAQFIKEYGIPETTHHITETRVLEIISNTLVLVLPVGLATAGLTPTIPLSATSGITDTTGVYTNSVYVIRPISYFYAETIVKGVFSDQFTQSYNAALKGGLCAGMVATVAEFLASGTSQRVETYGGEDTIRSIPETPLIEEFIQRYHGRQVSDKVLRWLAQYGRHNPKDLYQTLLEQLGKPNWQANPQIIGIVKGADCKDIEIGHALLPYKVEPRAGGIGRIYVYDPNYVDALPDTHYIDVNLNANTWTYELAPVNGPRPAIIWTGSALYSTPLSMFREKPTQPTAGSSVLLVDGGTTMSWGGTTMSWGGTTMSWGHDSSNGKAADGTHTGCVDNGVELSFVQEITRTMKPIPFGTTPVLADLDDLQAFPNTLLFPAGQDWTFTGNGARSDHLGDMMLFGPHALAGFVGFADESTQDIATIDAPFHSLSLRTTDASKPVSVYQMHETDAWTRIYAASNINLGAGEAITLTVSTDLNTFELINSALVTKTFDLGMGHIGSDGISTIVHQKQVIGPNERRIYTPIVWTDVANSPVLVQIDVNADGSVDYVELKDGGVLPVATLREQLPEHARTPFTMISHEHLAPGHIGWINLDYPLAPGQEPTSDMRGNNNTLRQWIAKGGQQHMRPNGSFVGIPGTHGGLFNAIGSETPGSEDLYRVGDIVLIPIFDQVVDPKNGELLSYHISGIAVARILSSTNSDGGENDCNGQPNCNKVIVGELLMKLEY